MSLLRSLYHYLWALVSALWFRFPSRTLCVIGVTGTKGKSTTVELVNAILEEGGYKTAVAGTIRFKIGNESRPNLFKMTMPGRSFLQGFLREAVQAGCTHAIIEMTSEGVKQSRHKFIDLDALIFTNIAPEHIESHGSFEKYLAAKLELPHALAHSSKKNRLMIVNGDDPHGKDFLGAAHGAKHISFSLKNAEPYTLTEKGIDFTFDGMPMHSPLIGEFNLMNILAAATLARAFSISKETILSAVAKTGHIAGRVEKIDVGQTFEVIVDYAHTPESLGALYKAFKGKQKICVLGATGGSRDHWKRPAMGKIADTYCDVAILTDEDPYDEDPRAIVEAVKTGFSKHQPEIIMDRRKAIAKACSIAKNGEVVLITGKGTDPYIMRANGAKELWSDAQIAREALEKRNDLASSAG